MKPYLIFAPKRSEMAVLSSVVGFLIRKRGENQIPFFADKLERVSQYLEGENTVRLMVCDVTADGVLPVLEQLRRHNAEMRLVLLADDSISPISYIRPTILPTSLLWRPLQTEGTKEVLWEVISTLPADDVQPAEEETQFTIEVRGAVRQFSYRDILFFEARDKRLYLHASRKEIPFSGTLEKLNEELPQGFIRVHKSYIVNRARISEIQYGQNLLILEGGMMIPISRSYKADVKAVFS